MIMKTTFTILFFMKRVSRKRTTKFPVMYRITVNKSTAQFSTKLLVNEEQWDAKGNKGIGSFAEIKAPNDGNRVLLYAKNKYSPQIQTDR